MAAPTRPGAAAFLAAGLDGIVCKLEPLPSTTAASPSGPTWASRPSPGTLQEALAALAPDSVIREALGPACCDYYIDFKRQEWSDYHNTISPWEVEKCLTLF